MLPSVSLRSGLVKIVRFTLGDGGTQLDLVIRLATLKHKVEAIVFLDAQIVVVGAQFRKHVEFHPDDHVWALREEVDAMICLCEQHHLVPLFSGHVFDTVGVSDAIHV